MHRQHFLFALIVSAWAVLAPARALAQPLVLAGAVNETAFVGDGNVTFSVQATGSPAPTYQWQTGTPGNFANLTDNATFGGSTTPTLTINISDLTLNGTEYRCKVTSNSVTANSWPGVLTVYSAPTATPSLTVTPSTVAANSAANITIKVTGLNAGDTVRVQRFLDSNDDGKTEVSKPLVQSLVVTDGGVTQFGGITDADIPGDDDGAADGTITTHITLPTSPEGGQLAGSYIIKVVSPTGEFEPVTQELTVTQPNDGQTVSGQVTSGGSPVPYASVILLSSGQHSSFVAGTVADANGNYSLEAPVGSYNAIGFSLGYVQAFSDAASVTLSSGQNQTGANLSLTPATCTITTPVTDTNSSAPLRGVQVFLQSNNNGQVSIVSSNADGILIAAVTPASDWDFQISQYATHALGYLQPQNDPMVDTTSGSVEASTPAEGIQLPAANALIYGDIETSLSAPLAGVIMDDNDSYFQDEATTHSDGSYFLLANGPASGQGDNWDAGPDNNNPVLAGYVSLTDVNVNVFSGNAYLENFVATAPTAFLQGTVTNNGTPVVGVSVDAQPQSGGNNIQATTDNNGNFSIGVGAGTYNVNLDDSSTDADNLVTPQLTETVSNNQTLSGIALQVLSATDIVSGTVDDANGDPLSSNYNVSASTTISGVQYVADANLDNNGDGGYSLPLVNGSWTFNVYGQNGTPPNFQSTTVTITGNQTVNLAPPQATAFLQGTVTNNGTPVVGVTVDASPQNGGNFFSTTTDSNGNFTLGLSAGTWNVYLDQGNANLVGTQLTETLSTNQTISGLAFPVLTATDIVTGTVTDANGNPLSSQYNVNATTTISGVMYVADANLNESGNGTYSLGLVSGDWTFSVYGPSSSGIQATAVNVTGNQTVNLAPIVPTAFFQGTVTNNGSPVSGVVMDAQQQGGNDFFQATTDSDGNFNLGVVAGTWNIYLDNTSGIINSSLSGETITDCQTISDLTLDELTATGTISGAVYDYNGNPVSNNTVVFATATINGISYISNASTDNNGDYSLLAVNGEWVVQVNDNSLNFNSQNVAVTGSATANFTATVFTSEPSDQTVSAAQNAAFSVNINIPSSSTIQWQVSTDGGSTWNNLSDDATYSGSATNSLTVNNTTTDMSGYEYECVVSFTYNSSPVSQTSDAATLTVTEAPTFSQQPGNQTITVGDNTTFTVAVGGSPAPTYQWQVSTDGGTTWSNLSDDTTYADSTTGTLEISDPTADLSGDQYQCIVSNSVNTVTSNAVTLTINTLPATTWAQTYFSSDQLANSTISGPTASPAGDGIPNLLKYAFDLNPFVNGRAQLPQPSAAGGQLLLAFTAMRSDIVYTVEASTDLVNWSTDGVTLQSNGNEITASYNLSGNAAAFMRIVVSPAPVVPAPSSGEPSIGVLGVLYDYTPTPPSGSGLTWSLAPGSSLPPGLSLNPDTGEITGMTNETGVYTVTLQGVDQEGGFGTTVTLVFVPPGRGAPVVQIVPTQLSIVLPDNIPQTFTIANVGPVGSVLNYNVADDGALAGYLSFSDNSGGDNNTGSLSGGQSATVFVSIQSQFVNDSGVAGAVLVADVYTPGATNFVKVPVSVNVYTEQELADNLLGEWSGTWSAESDDADVDDAPSESSTANSGTWTLDIESIDAANNTATGTLTMTGSVTYWTQYSAENGYSYTANIQVSAPLAGVSYYDGTSVNNVEYSFTADVLDWFGVHGFSLYGFSVEFNAITGELTPIHWGGTETVTGNGVGYLSAGFSTDHDSDLDPSDPNYDLDLDGDSEIGGDQPQNITGSHVSGP